MQASKAKRLVIQIYVHSDQVNQNQEDRFVPVRRKEENNGFKTEETALSMA